MSVINAIHVTAEDINSATPILQDGPVYTPIVEAINNGEKIISFIVDPEVPGTFPASAAITDQGFEPIVIWADDFNAQRNLTDAVDMFHANNHHKPMAIMLVGTKKINAIDERNALTQAAESSGARLVVLMDETPSY